MYEVHHSCGWCHTYIFNLLKQRKKKSQKVSVFKISDTVQKDTNFRSMPSTVIPHLRLCLFVTWVPDSYQQIFFEHFHVLHIWEIFTPSWHLTHAHTIWPNIWLTQQHLLTQTPSYFGFAYGWITDWI